ncbi:MAG: uracil-DNA glycosylase [Deltaproteobacteria bacterium]|nr:uracil-DNA glycosylase [Deltaproteobacteria bacterium]
MTVDRDDLPAALALLARGLQGAIDVAGLEHLPRPTFSTQSPTQIPASAAIPQPTKIEAPATIPAPIPVATTTTTAAAADPAEILRSLPSMPIDNANKLRILRDDVVGDCTRCKLHRGRNKLVFGAGNPQARLVFVGEGPGADEDREGVPFVGRAGQLLTKMIGAMGFARDDVYICNVVKCRPPNNRDPEPDEVEACEGFLRAQLAILQPVVIVALGRAAAHTLLRTQTPISKLRGTWQRYEGVELMPTYHPSYLLREERDPQQAKKREAWSDLQQVMKRLSG